MKKNLKNSYGLFLCPSWNKNLKDFVFFSIQSQREKKTEYFKQVDMSLFWEHIILDIKHYQE